MVKRNSKGQFAKGNSFWLGKKRLNFKAKTSFQKGIIPWNKGKKMSKEHCEKLSISQTGKVHFNAKGKKHYNWKGENGGYETKHVWISKHRGKASKHKCEHCGKQAQHWSNKDHKYSRNFEDYQALCVSCHRKYDKLFIKK